MSEPEVAHIDHGTEWLTIIDIGDQLVLRLGSVHQIPNRSLAIRIDQQEAKALAKLLSHWSES
jgi:hypothetical protein